MKQLLSGQPNLWPHPQQYTVHSGAGSLKKLLPWKSKIHSDIWKGTQSRIKVLWSEKAGSLRLFFSDEQFIHIRHSTIQMSDWMKIWSWTFMIMEQIIGHTSKNIWEKRLSNPSPDFSWRPLLLCTPQVLRPCDPCDYQYLYDPQKVQYSKRFGLLKCYLET